MSTASVAHNDRLSNIQSDDSQPLQISLHAGKEGLNLQFCQRAVLVEPDYNPSAEEQAMDRCHRIGQTKDVHIHKFFIKGSLQSPDVRFSNASYNVPPSFTGWTDSLAEGILI